MGRMLNSRVPRHVNTREGFVPPPVFAAAEEVPALAPVAWESSQDRAQRQNPLRKVALYATLGFLFLRLTAVSEILTYYTHAKFYLLYLFAPLAIFGMLTTGGFGRTFRHNAARYWVAFFVWMLLATPFSFWKGNSAEMMYSYGRVQIAMLFVVAGLAMSWSEIRLIFYTMAAAALANLGTARLFGKLDEGGRTNLVASGNIGNSNDLGSLLLLLIPFVLFIVFDRKRAVFVRMCLLPALAYCVWVVLGTASRGCMIAMGVMFLFAALRASPGQRMAILVAGVVLAIAVPALLPGGVLTRLSSLFKEKSENNAEALESSAARAYLLKQSLKYTFQHPIFGVGPGQFPNYEGTKMMNQGQHGQWKVTHNFLTQVSSECGIPALIFMLLSLGSAMGMVNRTYFQARKKGFSEIANACFCYQLGMIGYLSAIVFLAQAYHVYLPIMVGLAIAISTVAARSMSAQETPGIMATPVMPLALR
jgi:O-Antigen ligase